MKGPDQIEWFSDYDWQGVIVTIARHSVRHLVTILKAFRDWSVRSSLFNPVSPVGPHATALMAPMSVLIEESKRLIDVSNRSRERLVVDNIESIVVSLLASQPGRS